MNDLPAHAEPSFLREATQTLLGGQPYLTGAEAADRAGMRATEADALWQALGFPNLGEEAAFTDGDVAALIAARQLMDTDIVDENRRLAQARLLGRAMAALAESQVALTVEASARGALATPFDLVETMESLQSYIWRRHLLAAGTRLTAQPVEGSAPVAVGFTDLVSYTARSRQLSPELLESLLDEFERTAQGHIVDRGGRVVKTLGDEVMWVVHGPTATAATAAGIALALAGPDVRTGVAFGPTLARAGDHYGPTVNVAARLTALARPGTVLIDRAMAGELEGNADYQLRHLRPLNVRGYDHLRATVLSAR